MSTAQQALGDALRSLPKTVRVWLYAVFGLLGTALAVAPQVGIADLGPLTLTEALQVYAFLAPAMASIAVSNAKRSVPADPSPRDYRHYREEADIASFAPVGSSAEVYG